MPASFESDRVRMASPQGTVPAEDAIDWTYSGPRVSCRLVDDRDGELYRALYTSPAIMAEVGPTMTVEQADATFAKACRHNRHAAATALARYWLVARTTTGASLGIVSLVRDPANARCGMIGAMLLEAWQNRGIALPGVAGMVAGALSGRWPLGMDLILGYHTVSNPNSGRLTEGLGFTRMPDRDGYGVWRLSRDEWPACLDRWPRSMRVYAARCPGVPTMETVSAR